MEVSFRVLWRTDTSFDGFLESFLVPAGDVDLGSVALEGLGDDEA
jgi:hypothetical protein